jgi:hypothetical protein
MRSLRSKWPAGKQFICRWNSLLFQAAYATASANSIRSITIATLTCLMHA